MQKWRVTITESAVRDLRRLPSQVQDEIAQRHIPAIAQNPYAGKPLKGAFKGVRAYRFGHHPEYRILYRIVGDEVRIVQIGKREDIYRR
jgi:addiction module RelE/StbE family toxin